MFIGQTLLQSRNKLFKKEKHLDENNSLLLMTQKDPQEARLQFHLKNHKYEFSK